MTPAVRFLAAAVAAILAVDLLFKFGVLPGGTISRGVEGLAAAHPWVPAAYAVLVVFGYYHFFG